jgi:hypothetical protein
MTCGGKAFIGGAGFDAINRKICAACVTSLLDMMRIHD